jgi:hypothetical protein
MAEGQTTEPKVETMQDRLAALHAKLNAARQQLERISPGDDDAKAEQISEARCEYTLVECEAEAETLLMRATYIADHVGAL